MRLGMNFCANSIYLPNKTKKMFLDMYRPVIQDMPGSYSELDSGPYHYTPSKMPVTLMLFSGNGLGKVIHSFLTPALDKIIAKRFAENTHISVVRTLIALKSYVSDHEELPLSLEAIVPRYLSEVPIDAYDGQPLRYSAGKKIVYSIGKDLKDWGGFVDGCIPWEMSDPSFRIDF